MSYVGYYCDTCNFRLDEEMGYCSICPHCNSEKGLDDLSTLSVDYAIEEDIKEKAAIARNIADKYKDVMELWETRAEIQDNYLNEDKYEITY